jgi:hypothetical protein
MVIFIPPLAFIIRVLAIFKFMALVNEVVTIYYCLREASIFVVIFMDPCFQLVAVSWVMIN